MSSDCGESNLCGVYDKYTLHWDLGVTRLSKPLYMEFYGCNLVPSHCLWAMWDT